MTEKKSSKLLKALWVLLAAIILLSAAFSQRVNAASTADYYTNAVLFWTNVERVRHGLPEFKTTDTLMKAAGKRAKELTSYYDHYRPNGSFWPTIFSEYKLTLKSAAENIARGQEDPCEVVASWMDSPGHRGNILNSKYSYLGTGYAYTTASDFRHHWEQLFSGRVDYAGAHGCFNVAPTGVSSDKNALWLYVGGTDQVTGIPAPIYATAEISCTSSNPNIVKVTGAKVNIFDVKGVSNGSATLTVKCGSFTKTVYVTVGSGESDGPYTDVRSNDFFCKAVTWATEQGITKGMDSTHFAPYNSCNRGQAVTFIWRAAGCPDYENTENPFEDVEKGSFCYDAVMWAHEMGIVNGYDEEHFAPKKTVTREQFISFLWRYNNFPEANIENPFIDVKSTAYYHDAVMWAYENNITNGVSQTKFGVGQPCSRYQVAVFLYNIMT